MSVCTFVNEQLYTLENIMIYDSIFSSVSFSSERPLCTGRVSRE